MLLSWDTLGQSNCLVSSNTTPVNEWFHVAVVYDGSQFSLYIGGQLVGSKSENSIPDGLGHSFYMGTPPDNLTDNNYDFHGYFNNTHLTDAVKYTSAYNPGIVTFSSDSIFLFDFSEGSGSTITDSVNGFIGTINGATWDNVCFDLDGDGVAAWEDCDDGDASVSASESGGSENCAAESCKTILDDGYSTGDGNYWIDPDGTGSFEVYCNMTTDSGGWTEIFYASNLNYNDTQLDYDINNQSLLNSVSEVMIAFVESNKIPISRSFFAIPYNWRTQSPMRYWRESEPVLVTVDGNSAF
jgi:hypothetical protein